MSKINLALVKEWLQIAYEDYDAALYLFENKTKKPLEIICYHCQQSTEKSLKGYLQANGIDPPKIHALRLLCNQCAEFNEIFTDYIQYCEELEIYVVGTRYPNRVEVQETDAKIALKQTREIYDFVLNQLQDILKTDPAIQSQKEDDPEM